MRPVERANNRRESSGGPCVTGRVTEYRPVRSGLVVIGSWLALVLLAAVGIVGGFNSSSRQSVSNKRGSRRSYPVANMDEAIDKVTEVYEEMLEIEREEHEERA